MSNASRMDLSDEVAQDVWIMRWKWMGSCTDITVGIVINFGERKRIHIMDGIRS